MNQAVKNRVANCRDCYLGDLHHGPLPYTGKVGATFLVLGPAPSQVEDVERKIWVGKGGSIMRSIMRRAGVPNSDVAWGHVVSCRVPGKGKNGATPKDRDVHACRTMCALQVTAIGPRVVVLAGATAMRKYRPDWVFKDMVGWPFTIQGRLYVTVPHPLAAAKDDEVGEQILETVKWARMRARSGDLLSGFEDWPDVCSVCRGEMWVYDEMGVPYCREHGDLIGREQVGVQMRLVG